MMTSLSEIAKIRLYNQQLLHSHCNSAAEVVRFMGAMQAQDYAMAKWAIGIRLLGATSSVIEDAIDNGTIIRTHLMRPTWHFVAADDINWLLKLTAPRIQSAIKSRHKNLGISETFIKKCNNIIERALNDTQFMTRAELLEELKRADIPINDNNTGAHILFCAELEGLICSGKHKNRKQTYTLFQNWVANTEPLDIPEAAAKLAERYFRSHGPATLEDFIWWSGLSITVARNGLEAVKHGFSSETFQAHTYWFLNSLKFPVSKKPLVHLLPAFDEFLISYKNRNAAVNIENYKKAVSSNGIFRSVIIIDGRVTGLWNRVIKKDCVVIETFFFREHSKKELEGIEEAAERFGAFLGGLGIQLK